MNPAEGERRGEDRDVARLEAIHGMLVAVEADEFLVVRTSTLLPYSLRLRPS
jgi:hypothetical protein